MNNYLGKNIATQRHAARMTQEQLAELSDMTINYLSKIEQGGCQANRGRQPLPDCQGIERLDGIPGGRHDRSGPGRFSSAPVAQSTIRPAGPDPK